jgi:phospholipid-binding lipoprotein MlaA
MTSAIAVTVVTLLTAYTAQAAEVNDPLEPANRAIFRFNEVADKYVLKPVAQGYDYVVPDVGKHAVTNVLRNLAMPITFINSIFQADADNSFKSFWSFALNSTFGIAGIFDFAGTNTDLYVHREDFGQTLGAWGVGSGAYLVIPLLGPSNLRDLGGMGVDYATDPYTYIASTNATYIRQGMQIIDARYSNLKLVDDVYAQSIDPYATFRSGYSQHRDAEISNTKSSDVNEE